MSEYPRAVAELEALGIMPTDLPKLTPMQRALERTGLLARIDPSRQIVIAGTNGKGSTAATLSRLLHSAGEKVGLYTSPHLVTTRERFRVGEQDLSEKAFVEAYRALKPVIAEERLTHFEALTLIAAHVFTEQRTSYTIWEVGLGGLYDATNAIPHEWCAITRIGLDHQAILGDTLEMIARQKFGVITPRAQAVLTPLDPSIEHLGLPEWQIARPVELKGLHLLKTAWGPAEMKLAGPRAAENTATALTLFERLGFDPGRYLSALSEVRWPGRFQRAELEGFQCPVYLSGDHNPQGVESLMAILEHLHWDWLHLVVGIGKDKEAETMLERLASLPRVSLSLTETPFKPLPLEAYPERFAALACQKAHNPGQILEKLRDQARPGDLVVVTGSLYLVGQVMPS